MTRHWLVHGGHGRKRARIMGWSTAMLTGVFLGIMRTSELWKLVHLMLVGMETCHGAPPAGEGEYEAIAHEY